MTNGFGLPLNLILNLAGSPSVTVTLSSLLSIFGPSRTSSWHDFSTVPYSLTARDVIVPMCNDVTLGITSVNLSLVSFSKRTPSLVVNSFPFNNQDIFGFGFDVTSHSNFYLLRFLNLLVH